MKIVATGKDIKVFVIVEGYTIRPAEVLELRIGAPVNLLYQLISNPSETIMVY